MKIHKYFNEKYKLDKFQELKNDGDKNICSKNGDFGIFAIFYFLSMSYHI